MSNVPKLADYLGKPFKCSCGRTHSTGLEGCTVGVGVLTSLVDYVEKYGFKKVYVLAMKLLMVSQVKKS